MRFLCWAIFCLLLGSSAGWSLEEEVNVIVDKTLPNEIAADLITEPIKRVRGKNEEKFSVIRREKLGTVLDSLQKKQQAYLSINRYERVNKTVASKNQSQLKIDLVRDIEPTIRAADKPLVFGGKGFDTAGLEASDHSLHFTFNSHMKVPTHYELKKEDISYFDPSFERAQSRKFLIFHRSSSSFGRKINFFEEPNLEEPLKQKMVYVKSEAVPSSWIFLDAHVKEFQNKETSLRLIPAKSPLDLIYDNPAILQYDYQLMNSGGSQD